MHKSVTKDNAHSQKKTFFVRLKFFVIQQKQKNKMGCDCSKEQDKEKDLVTLYSKFAVDQNVESTPGIET